MHTTVYFMCRNDNVNIKYFIYPYSGAYTFLSILFLNNIDKLYCFRQKVIDGLDIYIYIILYDVF